MTRILLTSALLFAAPFAAAQAPVVPASAAAAAPEGLNFEDQFGRKADLTSLKGHVVILVYGDRSGNDVCRAYGEQLHILFHPTAKGQPPAQARLAPAAPLPGLPAGKAAPNVVVVPVACAGKVPSVVKEFLQTAVKKGSPDVVVWMDFAGAMAERFQLKSGDVNLAVFDAEGRFRLKQNGAPDQSAGLKIVQAVQDLRAEGAK